MHPSRRLLLACLLAVAGFGLMAPPAAAEDRAGPRRGEAPVRPEGRPAPDAGQRPPARREGEVELEGGPARESEEEADEAPSAGQPRGCPYVPNRLELIV